MYFETFRNLRNLTHLYLQENHITFIPKNLLEDLVELKVLKLDNNRISMFTFGSFEANKKLELLTIDNNTILRNFDPMELFQKFNYELVDCKIGIKRLEKVIEKERKNHTCSLQTDVDLGHLHSEIQYLKCPKNEMDSRTSVIIVFALLIYLVIDLSIAVLYLGCLIKTKMHYNNYL